MTLLTTEIHAQRDATVVIFAADRRISRAGRDVGEAQKVFRVPGSRVGVGFFGIAEFRSADGVKTMSDLLDDLVNAVPVGSGPRDVAGILLNTLRAEMPYGDAMNEALGFHVCGFAHDSTPEFWYVRNVDDDGIPTGDGFESREDFRARDREQLLPGQYQIYRNGDLRGHVASWTAVDTSLGALLGTASFRALETPEDLRMWVKTKMELIGSFYQRFSTEQIIGNPIDSFAISSDD